MEKQYSEPVPLECPDDIFAKLLRLVGSQTSDREILDCVTLGQEDCNFTGDFFINLPPTSNTLLSNWDEVENWLYDFDFGELDSPKLYIETVFGFEDSEHLDENFPLPKKFCSTLKEFEGLVLKVALEYLRTNHCGTTYYEVTNKGQTLVLINHDIEMSSLMGIETLYVYRSWDEVNEESGYFS